MTACMHEAEPGDIYTDEGGKLWRIMSVCREPTIEAEEVEGSLVDPNVPPNPFGQIQASQALGSLQSLIRAAYIEKRKQTGPTGSRMWGGWSRIWRRPATP